HTVDRHPDHRRATHARRSTEYGPHERRVGRLRQTGAGAFCDRSAAGGTLCFGGEHLMRHFRLQSDLSGIRQNSELSRCEGTEFLRTQLRRGTALVVVLVVIVLMTLAAYTFSELMIVERQAADRYGRDTAARAFADSGIELAAA